jgi:hypothetical protein
MIQQNNLETVSGYPVVLHFLAAHSATGGQLTKAQVWRGIITALLGERLTNPHARHLATEPEERFDAACRIAAAATLTGQETVRESSLDSGVLTFNLLWHHSENRPMLAAREACQTSAFARLPEQGAFRFSRRNIQDWLTAFALERLPLPALRSALAEPDGTLTERMRESARLIRYITTRAEVRADLDRLGGGIILPADAAGVTCSEALRYLDQLEHLAQSAPWGLRLYNTSAEQLGRLRVEGMENILAERLRDAARPPQVKKLLLEVAEATKAAEVSDAAVELVLDPSQRFDLRMEALLFVCRFGGDVHIRHLVVPIAEQGGDNENACRLRAVLIHQILKRKFWPVWKVGLFAPAKNLGVIDQRGSLLAAIAEQMTIDDAHQLIPHLKILHERHRDTDYAGRLSPILDRILNLLIQQTPLNPQDCHSLMQLAFDLGQSDRDWATARDIAIRLQHHEPARRGFYENDMNRKKAAPDDRGLSAFQFLRADDIPWLRQQALDVWTAIPDAWHDLYWLARQAQAQQKISAGEWDEIVKLVEEKTPGHPARYEGRAREMKLAEQQAKAEREEAGRKDPTQKPLAERANAILAAGHLDAVMKMRALGFVCFGGIVGLMDQAQGKWEDLADDLRQRVLDACTIGLESGQPIPLPQENLFTPQMLGEAAAFTKLVFSAEAPRWLHDGLISRWLPGALAWTSPDWVEMIRVCWSVSQSATESVLIQGIELEIRRREQPILQRNIPSECWTDATTDRVVQLLLSGTVSPIGCRKLLEELACRCPERADPIAATWATSDEPGPRRQAALHVLLGRNPGEAIPLIESDYERKGKEALQVLTVVWAWRGPFEVRWETWPLNFIERLARLLIRGYPRAFDGPFHERDPGQEFDLCQLRDRFVDVLLQRDDTESQAALDRLATLDPAINQQVDNHRASVQASRLIPSLDPTTARDPSALSVGTAVSLLDRAGYRLIRSSGDLFEATVECLRTINSEMGYDLPMLYGPPDRSKKGEKRKHLEEDALQAYLRRRLLELLPRLADGVQVMIPREDQVQRRQRLDLRVLAPCHGSRELATVVIEVKWSTNVETVTGLTDQLGTRYLLGEKLTHGIFLVGWSGEWRPLDGTGLKTDMNELRDKLGKQGTAFCAAHPALVIEPVLLDARWSLSE